MSPVAQSCPDCRGPMEVIRETDEERHWYCPECHYHLADRTVGRVRRLDAARSATSALTPKQAIGWALAKHELPDGSTVTVQQQADAVLRLLDDNGYRVVAKEES